MDRLGKYMLLSEMPQKDGTKTRRWAVLSARSNDVLGQISWFGRWRQYTFSPMPETTFNSECLRDLIAVLNEENVNYRRQRHEVRDG